MFLESSFRLCYLRLAFCLGSFEVKNRSEGHFRSKFGHCRMSAQCKFAIFNDIHTKYPESPAVWSESDSSLLSGQVNRY
jgi:hypothetical protein